MADDYGRGGVQVGGKGGLTKSSAYDFSPREAGSYLSGEAAGEYAQASSILRGDLPTTGKGKQLAAAVAGKKKAKESVGKLREIAGAQAVGEFLDFAGGMGRGTQTTASRGLLSGESYAPSDMASYEAQANIGAGKYQKILRKSLGLTAGSKQFRTSIEGKKETTGALRALAATEFGGDASLGYSAAMTGSDPRAALYQTFQKQAKDKEQGKALLATTPVPPSRPWQKFGGAGQGMAALQAQRQRTEQLGILNQSPQMDYLRSM